MFTKEDTLAIIKALLLAKTEGIIGFRQTDRLIRQFETIARTVEE